MAHRWRFWRRMAQAFSVAGCNALALAQASAEDYSACAKIGDPLAYNQCLAKYGPSEHRTKAAPPSDGARSAGGWQISNDHGRVRTTIKFARGNNGKMRAEFSVGQAPSPAIAHQSKTKP